MSNFSSCLLFSVIFLFLQGELDSKKRSNDLSYSGPNLKLVLRHSFLGTGAQPERPKRVCSSKRDPHFWPFFSRGFFSGVVFPKFSLPLLHATREPYRLASIEKVKGQRAEYLC